MKGIRQKHGENHGGLGAKRTFPNKSQKRGGLINRVGKHIK
jgi:hypothetical protein